MTALDRREADRTRAEELWSEYLQRHDLSDKVGQTAGIDTVSGRIWLGDSIEDVVAQRDADGIEALLYFMRVGFPFYYRKGGHR